MGIKAFCESKASEKSLAANAWDWLVKEEENENYDVQLSDHADFLDDIVIGEDHGDTTGAYFFKDGSSIAWDGYCYTIRNKRETVKVIPDFVLEHYEAELSASEDGVVPNPSSTYYDWMRKISARTNKRVVKRILKIGRQIFDDDQIRRRAENFDALKKVVTKLCDYAVSEEIRDHVNEAITEFEG
jgi:hypothetical protein